MSDSKEVAIKVQKLVTQLQGLGQDSYRNTLRKHGAQEPLFGVKIDEMKKLMKPYKGDLLFACALFDTGIYDAQYMAGLLADGRKMNAEQLQHWCETANSHGIREYSVAWVTAESEHALALALRWIASDQEAIAAAGWCTLTSYIAITDDAHLPMATLEQLLGKVQTEIHGAKNRVCYCMNSYVIGLGSYVAALSPAAIAAAKEIGVVTVDVGDTACKVAFAPDYIEKCIQRGSLGKKRKTAKC